jgi:hypothetical protein
MNNELFVNHKLNFDEAMRRIEYWAAVDDNANVLHLLIKALIANKGNLYFEEAQ